MRVREPRMKRKHKRETGSAREGRAKSQTTSRVLGFWSWRAGIKSHALSPATGGAGKARRAASNAARAAQPRVRSPAQLVPRAPPRRRCARGTGMGRASAADLRTPRLAHPALHAHLRATSDGTRGGVEWEERARRIFAHLVSRTQHSSPRLPTAPRVCAPAAAPCAPRALRSALALLATHAHERMPSPASVLDPGAARPRAAGLVWVHGDSRRIRYCAAYLAACGTGRRTVVPPREHRPLPPRCSQRPRASCSGAPALVAPSARSLHRTYRVGAAPCVWAPHRASRDTCGRATARCAADPAPDTHVTLCARGTPARAARVEIRLREEETHQVGISTRGSCTVWSGSILVC
ncbi:hypothetical protein DFH09DRAFT_1079216 [Mycena vulgaris]|nr:hypothetical protein DFH09DRAFT_1079216 [Mycena vulgaris]